MRKDNLYKILFLVLFWVLAALLIMMYEGALLNFGPPPDYQNRAIPYDFSRTLLKVIIVVVFVSTIISTIEILFLDKLLKKHVFGISLLIKTVFYLVSILFATAAAILWNYSGELGQPVYSDSVLNPFKNYFFSVRVLMIMVYWSCAVIIALFTVHVNDKLGRGVLINFIRGKYHSPREEKRIFMFLDLTSSTSIAEKLGTYNYSSFLKDFFFDIDEIIANTKGVILQYVGDEVFVTWKEKSGVENNNCIRCFFLVENKIEDRKKYYLNKYGVYPQFKAGLHYGNVIVSEVGKTKQELAYHGDTVNSASRIRSICRELNKRILVSAELLTILNNFDVEFTIESIGVSQLKGKENVIGLFSVEKI